MRSVNLLCLAAALAAAGARVAVGNTPARAAKPADAVLAGAAPTLTVNVDSTTGAFTLNLDGSLWFTSSAGQVCEAGVVSALKFVSMSANTQGSDAWGPWSGPSVTLQTNAGTPMVYTLKSYATRPSLVVATAAFPQGLNTAGCGGTNDLSTYFPSLNTSAGVAPTAGVMSWSDSAVSTTTTVQGLSNLQCNALDCGPVLTYPVGPFTASTPSVMMSSGDHFKIITQKTQAPASVTPGPVSALWSAQRNDQLVCLSQLCYNDQSPDGDYATQRIEGYAVAVADSSATTACLNGVDYNIAPLSFCYSQQADDNWNGCLSGALAHKLPDSSYTFQGANGFVLTDAGIPGTVPLQVYTRVYNATHTDWAAVASAAGLQWATTNNYTYQYTAGYIFTQQPTSCGAAAAGSFNMGVTAAIPALEPGFNYSVVFSAAYGGPTAATYAWGAALQEYYGTFRLPSITLEKIGVYTDDGAYYYVWEAFSIPARPWPAEVGMQLVIANLTASGVPVSYLQLDDWWYNGVFYFGNVKSITDYHASNASRLFPNGLPAFANALDLPLQLYTPFWADDYVTPYNMTESTAFSGTKLVTPADSYPFFSDLFDFSAEQTGGHFKGYEVDFLLDNFRGSASMFETTDAARNWYKGMADAAFERGVAIQYCLASTTDILQSLELPAVVQARASQDYVNKVANAFAIGGSGLYMGALAIAPSKDTLWTASPQPGTMSDTEHNGLSYTTQPHVVLDSVLATLSLGPVGISDGLGQTDVGLISQAYRSAQDGTLLRPSRPVSWVDSVLLNGTLSSKGVSGAQDVRATHAAVPSVRGGQGVPPVLTWYLLAWQTSADVLLGATDLYPLPPAAAPLALRVHSLPTGTQQNGCVNGQPAAPSCVTLLPAGTMPTVPATGTGLSNCSLTAVYTPLPNGAYFLGELAKFVHVSPQRFEYVSVGGAGPAGIVAGVQGMANDTVTVTAVDAGGITRVATVTIPAGGFVEVAL